MSPLRFVGFVAIVGLMLWTIWPAEHPEPVRAQPARTAAVDTLARASGPRPTLPEADSRGGIAPPGEGVLVEGQVIDAQQQPIAGATVRLATRTTVTENDGSFAFADAIAADDVRITAERGELYGETSTMVREGEEPIEITVRRGPTLVVRVVRKADDTPIANAKVAIAQRELYTSADGTIRARGLDPTGERFTVSAPGFASWRGEADIDSEFPTAERRMTVALSSGAPITGTVVDQDGKLVPSATVAVNAADGSWFDAATTDEHGVWTLASIGAGKHAIYATSDTHIATPEQIIAHDGVHPTTGIVVRVAIGAEIVGRVVDRAGKPVKGATVRGAPGAITDDDGRFRATGLDPGEVTLSAHDPTRASPERTVTIAAGTHTEVTLVVQDAGLAGRVVDKNGVGVADATLYARSADGSTTFFAGTDDYGTFDFGGVIPGDYSIVAQRPEESRRLLPDAPATYHAGQRDITIVVPEIATVTGRVALDGTPVTYFGVIITKSPDHVSESLMSVADASGTFAQHDIMPGTWSVVIVGPNFERKQIDNVVVTDGGTTDLGTIAVSRGRVVHGRVTDTLGRGVPDALVVIGASVGYYSRDRLTQRMQGDASARTGADGRFEIGGLSGDELHVVARAGTALCEEQVLAPADTTIDLVLIETGTVTGHIANLRERTASLAAFAGDGEHVASYFADIDRAGDYSVTVPSGLYQIRLIGSSSPTQPVQVPAGGTVRIDFDAADSPPVED